LAEASRFKNILVIHFGQLGDVVLGLPALNAIRRAFADSKITVMVGKSTAEIVRLAAVADEVIAVDRVAMRDGNPVRSVAKILTLVRDIRRGRFDLVIDLHSLSETNLLGYLAGIKNRLYANRENRSLDRLGTYKPPAEDKTVHLAQRYLDVLRPLGIVEHAKPFEFQISDLKLEIDASVGIFPGAGHPSRCWDLDKFARLATRLAADGRQIAVFLGPEETALRDQVAAAFPASTQIIEGLTLAEFIAALAKLSVFVCNDTGPMHLAGGAGAPIVPIIDERAPLTYLPLADRIEVVRSGKIDEIAVDDVHQAVLKLLK
jgi:heptosyltransferase-1